MKDWRCSLLFSTIAEYRFALALVLIPVFSFAQTFNFSDAHGKITYHVYGSGEYVILLSGGPGNHYRQLQDVAFNLSKVYSVILPEQRGTGESVPIRMDSTTINLQVLTDDIRLLMDHVGIKRAKIIGHSWGAMLAMNFATYYPERVKALCLISPGPYHDWDNNYKIIQNNVRSRLGKNEVNELSVLGAKFQHNKANKEDSIQFRRLARSAYIFDKDQLDSILPKIEVKVYPEMQQLMLHDIGRNFDLSKSLPMYKGRIDVICGRQDVLAFCAYELQMLNRSINVNWIDRCGHFPMFEKPDEFYSLLLKTLKSN